jgi:heme-degrading monooxygenase HmoA
MAEWTMHRWWVPDATEREFMEAWRVLAKTITGEGLMPRVSLFADVDEPRVRWTALRWQSESARRAWRADAQHRGVEDAVTSLCDGGRIHRMVTLLVVEGR